MSTKVMPLDSSRHSAAVTLALTTIQACFSINYIVSKVVVAKFPPLAWASLRAVVAGVLMLGLAFATRRERPTFSWQYIKTIGALSIIGTVINQTSFLVGLTYTSATNAAVICTLIPVFTLAFSVLLGRETSSWRKLQGFALAFAGVLVLRKIEEFSMHDTTLLGDALVILNCASYGLFLAVSHDVLKKLDPLWATASLLFIGGVIITLIALPQWLSFVPMEFKASDWGAIVFAIIGGTIVPYLLSLWSLARVRGTSVSLFIYLQPVFTSLLAWTWIGETPSLRTALATLLIFAGMTINLRTRGRQPTDAA